MFCIVHTKTIIFVLSIKSNQPLKNKKMKKRILFLSIALASLSAFSYAADAPVGKNVLYSFNKEFSKAHDVKWESRKAFIKASFTQDNKVRYAYFNNVGDLIAVTRFITAADLPKELGSPLQKSYASHWISDLFEVETANGYDYYVTIQNADETVILKSEGAAGWQFYKKEIKDAE